MWDKFNAFEAVGAEIPTIIPSNGCVNSFPVEPFSRWIPVKSDKVKALAKISEWVKRAKDNGYNEFDKDAEKLFAVVFESKYRFVKESAIDVDDITWKRYNAKVKRINRP